MESPSAKEPPSSKAVRAWPTLAQMPSTHSHDMGSVRAIMEARAAEALAAFLPKGRRTKSPKQGSATQRNKTTTNDEMTTEGAREGLTTTTTTTKRVSDRVAMDTEEADKGAGGASGAGTRNEQFHESRFSARDSYAEVEANAEGGRGKRKLEDVDADAESDEDSEKRAEYDPGSVLEARNAAGFSEKTSVSHTAGEPDRKRARVLLKDPSDSSVSSVGSASSYGSSHSCVSCEVQVEGGNTSTGVEARLRQFLRQRKLGGGDVMQTECVNGGSGVIRVSATSIPLPVNHPAWTHAAGLYAKVPFVQRLYLLLHFGGFNALRWNCAGDRVHVTAPVRLLSLLGLTKHVQLERLLVKHGFKKATDAHTHAVLAFAHPCFLRGSPNLLPGVVAPQHVVALKEQLDRQNGLSQMLLAASTPSPPQTQAQGQQEQEPDSPRSHASSSSSSSSGSGIRVHVCTPDSDVQKAVTLRGNAQSDFEAFFALVCRRLNLDAGVESTLSFRTEHGDHVCCAEDLAELRDGDHLFVHKNGKQQQQQQITHPINTH